MNYDTILLLLLVLFLLLLLLVSMASDVVTAGEPLVESVSAHGERVLVPVRELGYRCPIGLPEKH